MPRRELALGSGIREKPRQSPDTPNHQHRRQGSNCFPRLSLWRGFPQFSSTACSLRPRLPPLKLHPCLSSSFSCGKLNFYPSPPHMQKNTDSNCEGPCWGHIKALFSPVFILLTPEKLAPHTFLPS